MNGYYQQAYYNSHDSRKSARSHHQYFQHPAFGGTLSPMLRRQRAFHDAIYEEEYGSDQEDECCQSRGMSAVFCWFLSVIILIGLAASVVLTVFFILKSKSHMSKNGELDLFLDGDHGISYHMPDTTTELNSNLDFSSSAASSKEASIPSSISIEDDDDSNDETENNIQFGTLNKSNPKSPVTSSTTRFPPSRKGPSEISDEKVLRSDASRSSETARTSSERPRTSPNFRESSTERPKSDESRSQESSNVAHSSKSNEDHQATMYTTTTTGAPVQQILFTSSPDIVVTPPGHRRNLQTTRFPTGRTSFSTSTPAFDGTNKVDSKSEKDENSSNKDDEEKSNKSSVTPSTNNEADEEEEDDDDDDDTEEDETHQEPQLTLTTKRQEEPVTSPSTIPESNEHYTTEADAYKSEESQLNKMLLDEIPPHDHSQTKEEVDEDSPEEKDSSEEETSQSPFFSSEFNLPPTTLQASSPSSTSETSTSTTTTSIVPPVKDIVRLDPLARLIKNLAPKWGRNRTVESTTLSSGSHKYDFTISSREKENQKSSKETTTPEYTRSKSKYKTKETSTRSTLLVTPDGTRTRFQSSRPNSPAVETVSILKSPDLSRRHDQETENSEGVGQFLDILVGSEDHKTLITKQTEDGIVTSAILPPWFNNAKEKNSNSSASSSSTTSSTTTSTTSAPSSSAGGSNSPGETSSEEEASNSGSGSDENTASVFGGLFDLFKKEVAASITPTTTNIPTSVPQDGSLNTPDYSDPKRIILKRPGGEMLAQGTSNFAQNSGGNTNGIFSTDKTQRKPAMSFRDMIKTAAPALLSSSTTIATVDPAVVTDDITPANNGFHYNSPDGGTNIYGYYPDDDDKDNDKTVEHMGVQSESMSDEIIDRVHPSHSIEVHVPDESAEIVIEHDNNQSSSSAAAAADPKFGEAQAESTNQGKYVEPPIFHGGGIRKPLEEDEDLLHEPDDLDTRSSETHAVFAVPLNVSTSSPPVPPKTTNSSRSMLEKITQRISYVSPSPPVSKVSQEVVDNSAEKDPLPNNSAGLIGSMEYEDASLTSPQGSSVEKAQSPTGPEGSYEEDINGSLDHKPTKWSEQDKYGSTEAEASPQETHNESHSNLESKSGDTNDVLDRKPVVHLDEKLYPDSAGETSGGTSLVEESEETKAVHQVFPDTQKSNSVSTSSTTERPAGESSISQPESSADSSKSSESNKGFNPPTPVSFHDNKYTFSPPPPESIYQSKDGWRPIMKSDGEESSRPVSTAPPFWRREQPILIPTRLPTSPSTSPPVTNNPVVKLTNSPLAISSKPPMVDPNSSQQQQLLEDDEEYEEEEEEIGEGGVSQANNNNAPHQDQSELNNNNNNENYSWGTRERLMEQSKVKFPDQTHEDFDQDVEPQPQLLQLQPHPQQVQPHPIQMVTQTHPQQQMQQHPQHPQQRPHPLNPQLHQQQQHRPIPKQLQHLPPPPHHATHQQRQQFLYQQNNHNQQQHHQQQHQNNIDRSKYLMRPAPPPIVMRRAPIQNMPYLPSRDGPVRRQGLVAQVVPPQQQNNQQNNQNGDPSPSEFHPQYNNNLRRRFKTLGARPRSNNNLNWPQQQEQHETANGDSNVDSIASKTVSSRDTSVAARPTG